MASEGETPNMQQAAGRNGSSVNGAEVRRPRPPGPNDVQPTSGKTPPNKNPLMRPRPWWLSFLLVLILNYLLVQLFLPERPQQRIDVPYTFFKQQVSAANVADVTSRADIIQGTFKAPTKYPADQASAPTSSLCQTVMPQCADPGSETLLVQ